MYGTQVTVVPKQDQLATLAEWESIDQYRSLIAMSPINTKARQYPYIPSTETNPSSFLLVSSVPIQGPLQLIYMDGLSDAGLPHTRGTKGIVLPVFDLWNPNGKTMTHELVVQMVYEILGISSGNDGRKAICTGKVDGSS